MIKNIGIIGSGKAANNFCRNISVNKNFHLFSVFSRNIKHAEVFSKKFNATCYFDNLEDFLSQKNLDIIYIALPTSLHFQYAKKCLEAKKNTIVEKPLCSNIDEANILFAIAELYGVRLVEAIWTIYLPKIKNFMNFITHDVSNIKNVKSSICLPNTDLDNEIFTNKKAGGCLLDLGVYPLHLMSYIDENFKEIKVHDIEKNQHDIETSIKFEITYESFKFICLVSILSKKDDSYFYIKHFDSHSKIFHPIFNPPFLFNNKKKLKHDLNFYINKILGKFKNKLMKRNPLHYQLEVFTYNDNQYEVAKNRTLLVLTIIDKLKKIYEY